MDALDSTRSLLQSARFVMGGIDHQPTNRPFDPKANWPGRVWLSPPPEEAGQWADKLMEQIVLGQTTQVVCVVDIRCTSLQYVQMLCRLPSARNCITNWLQSEARLIVYVGTKSDAFVAEFSRYGMVLRVA